MITKIVLAPAVAGALLLMACSPQKEQTTEFTSSALAPVGTTAGKTCHARHEIPSDPQAWLPDPTCTPGKANPAVTLGQLCPVAHTKQWRPPVAYTNRLKREQLAQYDYTSGGMPPDPPPTPETTEEDHLISLELGGDPTAPENLWPEPHSSPNEKDRVESAAHAALCRGALTLPQAQQGIAMDWVAFGKRLGAIQ